MIPGDKRKLARTLFMEGLKTQQQIAEEVGVSERTIHTWIHKFTWDKLRLFALQAPVTIADNFCSQIVEMQLNIAGRNHGQRFPTAIEAEIMRKLVNSLEKMKKYPSLSTNMQVLETFRNYIRPFDPRFTADLSKYIESFIEGKSVNSYRPYQLEYGVSAEAPGAFYEEEEDLIPERVLCGNSPCKSPGNCHNPYCRLPHTDEPCADQPPLERYKPDLDYYPDSCSLPSTIDTPGLTTSDLRLTTNSRSFSAVSISEEDEKKISAAAISTDEIEILSLDIEPAENSPLADLPTATTEPGAPELSLGLTTRDLRLTTICAAATLADEIEVLPLELDAQENTPSAELLTATNELSTPEIIHGLTTNDLRLTTKSRNFSAVSTSEEYEKNISAAAVATNEIEPLTPDFDTEGEPPSGGLGVSTPELSTFDSLLSTEVNALVEARRKHLETHNPGKLKELTSYGKLPASTEEEDKQAMDHWEQVRAKIMAPE
jgi:DNA-binding XRE family transcriptional regulator